MPDARGPLPRNLFHWALFLALIAASQAQGAKLLPPAENGVYHSAHPDFGQRDDDVTGDKIRAFTELAGKKIVWTYIGSHWDAGIDFPIDSCKAANAEGVVPLVGIMPWSSLKQSVEEPIYTLERIIHGDFDDELLECVKKANSLGFPIMIELGPEANGSWFPWSGAWNGRGSDEYG